MFRSINVKLALLALVFAMASAFRGVPEASGQERERVTPRLALSRICVSEAGFPHRDAQDADSDGDTAEWIFTDDCAAIYAVLRFRAERHNMSFVTMARLYSDTVFDQASTRRRAWVGDLMPDGSRPRRWPTDSWERQRDGSLRRVPHAAWSNYARAWEATYEHAGQIVAGEVAHRCEAQPWHWGSPTLDRARAESAGWTEIDCGETRNSFWLVPTSAGEVAID